MMREDQNWYDRFHRRMLSLSNVWFGAPGERMMLFALLLPDLLRLMIKLLEDIRVSLLDKIFIVGVLLYVVSPIDFLPEILAGPFGIVEDLFFVGIMLVRLVGNPSNAEAIQEHWNGDPEIIPKIQRLNQHFKRFLTRRFR